MDKLEQLEGLLIRDLRVLVTLAERKHFAQAAEEFGISQPTLSALVKRVERIFGVTLFARTSRRFAITSEGEAVIRQVRSVLEELNRLATVLDDQHQPLVGRFRLGVIPTLGPYYIPHFLSCIGTEYPRLELVLAEAKTEVLLAQLRGRELDAALLALPVEEPALDALPLFREPFLLAVSAEHPLADREQVSTSDVNPRELLIMEHGNCLSDQTLSACGVRRSEELRPIHATSLETLRYMVATRIGVAVLPRLALSGGTRELPVRYLPFTPPEPARAIGLVFRRHSARRQDVQALAASLCGCLPSEVTPLAGGDAGSSPEVE